MTEKYEFPKPYKIPFVPKMLASAKHYLG